MQWHQNSLRCFSFLSQPDPSQMPCVAFNLTYLTFDTEIYLRTTTYNVLYSLTLDLWVDALKLLHNKMQFSSLSISALMYCLPVSHLWRFWKVCYFAPKCLCYCFHSVKVCFDIWVWPLGCFAKTTSSKQRYNNSTIYILWSEMSWKWCSLCDQLTICFLAEWERTDNDDQLVAVSGTVLTARCTYSVQYTVCTVCGWVCQ